MFFPMCVNLKDKKILVIGAGKVAKRKIKKIAEYGTDITVLGKEIKESEILKIKNLKIIKKNLENSQNEIEKIVKNYFLVITATDDADLNEKIALICDRNNILVNNVSSKTMMNTMFTGVVKNSEFQISISTNGKNCKRSRAMKEEIKKVLNKIENLENGEENV